MAIYYLNWELELIVKFRYELVVCQRLSHLHNSDDGCVDLILAILKDSFCCVDILLLL